MKRVDVANAKHVCIIFLLNPLSNKILSSYFSPALTSTSAYWIFFEPKIISLISTKKLPTFARSDCPGVPAFSTAAATALVGVPVTENEAAQNVKITTVRPSDDQNAMRVRTCSGFARRLSRVELRDILLLYYSLSKTTTSASFPSRSFFLSVSFGSAFGFSPASLRNFLSASLSPESP